MSIVCIRTEDQWLLHQTFAPFIKSFIEQTVVSCLLCTGHVLGSTAAWQTRQIVSLYGGSVIVEEWGQTNKWARTSNSNKCNKESIIFSCDRITWLDQEDARYGGWRWPLHGIAVSGKSQMMTESQLLRYRGYWRG